MLLNPNLTHVALNKEDGGQYSYHLQSRDTSREAFLPRVLLNSIWTLQSPYSIQERW